MTALDLPPLVEAEWLAERLFHPELRVLDASWYLPDAGRDARAEYEAAHLPGAIFVDLSRELADAHAPVRNTVAPPEQLARAFGSLGIGSDHAVVVYDHLAGYSAGRVWWTLTCAGARRVALLDGGIERWRALGLPLAREVPRFPPARFVADPAPRWLAGRDDVLRAVRGHGSQIVDARSAARFRGEAPEHTLRRGRIPGSLHVAWDENLAGHPPQLRSREELRALYEARGVDFARPVIASCGSGVTASLDAFVLYWLGHRDVAVYDGSWAEWGNDPELPIETGAP